MGDEIPLTMLALIRRYTGRRDIEGLQRKTLSMLVKFDLSEYGVPDRLSGMPGCASDAPSGTDG